MPLLIRPLILASKQPKKTPVGKALLLFAGVENQFVEAYRP